MQWRNGWIFKIYNSTNTAIYPYDFKISSFPDFPSFQCYQNYSTQKNTGICAVLTKYSLGGWRYKDTFVLSCFSCVQLCETLRTAACQAPLSMGFSRREYYSGLPCPPPGNLPDPGIKPGPPALQADSLLLSHQGSPKDAFAAAAAKSLQSCLTLHDPIDGSPRGSPIPGILQARTLEWVAISFSNAWKWKVKVKLLSRVRFLATPWTGSSVHGIFQAWVLEWGAIAFSKRCL